MLGLWVSHAAPEVAPCWPWHWEPAGRQSQVGREAGRPPGLAARLWAWPCADAALLLQPSMVMDLPFGPVCASSSWPLAAVVCPHGTCHSVAVGSHAMPCKWWTQLGVKCRFMDFKGRRSDSVLQSDLPKGGQPVPAWHCRRSYHLIWRESPLPAPQVELSVGPNC